MKYNSELSTVQPVSVTESQLSKERVVKKKESSRGVLDTLNSLISTNITGAYALQQQYYSNPIDKDYSPNSPKTEQLFIKYGVPYDETNIKELGANLNYQQLENKLKSRQELDRQSKVAEDAGLLANFAVGMLSPLDNIVGAGILKGTYKGAKYLSKVDDVADLSVGAKRTTEVVGSVGSGIASYGMLDASLNKELTLEQALIAGSSTALMTATIVGATIRPKASIAMSNIQNNGVQINPQKEIIIGLLASDADKLKASTNETSRDIGYGLNTSMDDVGLQDRTTAQDLLSVYKQDTQQSLDEYSNYIKNFESKFGRKYNPEVDDVEITQTMNRLDFEYNKFKDDAIMDYKQTKRNKDIETLRTNADLEIQSRQSKLQQEELDLQAKYDAELQVAKDVEINKNRAKLPLEERLKKVESVFQKKLTNGINKLRSVADKEVSTYNKTIESESRKLSKRKLTDEELIEVTELSRTKGREKLDNELLDSIKPEYREAIDILINHNRKYAKHIRESDLDGLSNLDENMYQSRTIDAKKVALNPEGAKQAYIDAISENYTTIDEKLYKQIDKTAQDIVDKISNTVAMHETIGLDMNTIKDNKLSTNATSSNLKGRKIRLDGSKLIDFMNTDVVSNLVSYKMDIGGKLALKKTFNIDKNYNIDKFILDKGLSPEDAKLVKQSFNAVKGNALTDPNASSTFSKTVRAFNKLNYINYGGWFGVNTATDLGNIVHDFGIHNVVKYATGDLVKAFGGKDRATKKLAKYLGLASESTLNNRALSMGFEGNQHNHGFKGEQYLDKTSALMSKLNGMNFMVDTMDMLASMSSLDYILTHNTTDKKFIKTMNRLGLSISDVGQLRSNSFANFDSFGAIDNINLDMISDTSLRAKLERALTRAVDDTVIKSNALDIPFWLTQTANSKAMAKLLWQFMTFPVVSHNKLLRKMKGNTDLSSQASSIATYIAILGLTTQLKDIGKEEPKNDLDTPEGQVNTAKFIAERIPFLGGIAPIQQQTDIIGRAIARANDTEYKSYNSDVNLGITASKFDNYKQIAEHAIDGKLNSRDYSNIYSSLSTNLMWIQPMNNYINDVIMDRKEFGDDIFKE